MFHKIVVRRFFSNILIFSAVLFLIGCGADSTEEGEKIPDVEHISISTAKSVLSTAPNDSVVITATLLDKNRGAISGADVTFSANTGILSASNETTDEEGILYTSKVTTDENGNAEIIFRAGDNKLNQTATITATSSNEKSASIPIPITGTTVDIELEGTSFIPGSSKTAKIIVTDAEENPVNNSEVIFSQTGSGQISFNDKTYYTDLSGEVEVELTGSQNGDVNFKAESLGSTASISLNVSGALDNSFQITDPDPSDEIFSTSFDPANGHRVKEVEVRSPKANNVVFHTDLGFWGAADSGEKNVTKSPVNNIAKAVLYSESVGIANISVTEKGTNERDSVLFAIADPSNKPSKINLTSSSDSIPPSSGDISYEVTLTAVVKSIQGQPVEDVPVEFSLKTISQGSLSDKLVFTNSDGEAETVFTSADRHISDVDRYVECIAEIDLPDDGGTEEAIKKISINREGKTVAIGKAGSETFGDSDTEMKYPMSVLVSDSYGNPAVNQKVYLNTEPFKFKYKDDSDDWLPDEEENKADLDFLDSIADSAAGTVPTFVVTDENGVAQFDYIYQERYGDWLKVKFKAFTDFVSNETTTSSITFKLDSDDDSDGSDDEDNADFPFIKEESD